jgi:hypothetical protein
VKEPVTAERVELYNDTERVVFVLSKHDRFAFVVVRHASIDTDVDMALQILQKVPHVTHLDLDSLPIHSDAIMKIMLATYERTTTTVVRMENTHPSLDNYKSAAEFMANNEKITIILSGGDYADSNPYCKLYNAVCMSSPQRRKPLYERKIKVIGSLRQ